MLFHRKRLLLLAVAATLLLGSTSCIFSPDEEEPRPDPPDPIPLPTSPENLIAALQVIYNDKVRSAQERRNAYSNLLPLEGFKFNFQPADVGTDPGGTGVPIPPDWGRDPEIASHERLFTAQENGQIFSLELTITSQREPGGPPPGRDDNWVRIFASNVFLRLMFNPNDGLEVNGGQAEFDCYEDFEQNRWFLGEWTDLPRP